MSTPEGNAHFKEVNKDSNVELRPIGNGHYYHLTRPDGTEAVICFDGYRQREQQRQLDNWIKARKRKLYKQEMEA